MSFDPVEMKKRAEAATQDRWFTDNVYGTVGGVEILFEGGCIGDTAASTCSDEEDLANAARIAASNPSAVLALLAAYDEQVERVNKLQARDDALREIVVAACFHYFAAASITDAVSLNRPWHT